MIKKEVLDMNNNKQAIYEKLRCKPLKVDYSYQRQENKNRINKIAKEWNDSFANMLYVSRRPDGDYIVDGNHTRFAAMKAKGDNYALPAKVFYDLQVSDEAAMFVSLNTGTKKPNYGETLKARVKMGDMEACAYINALETTKTPYSYNSNAEGRVRGHKTLLGVLKIVGYHNFVDALEYLKDCNQDVSAIYTDAAMLAGFIYFVSKYPQMNRKSFSNKLKKTSFATIAGDYQALRRIGSGLHSNSLFIYSEIFRGIYNKNRGVGRLDAIKI